MQFVPEYWLFIRNLSKGLAKRAATAENQLQRWSQLLDVQRSLAAAVTAASDRLRQLDANPSTRRKAVDTRHALQELQSEVAGLEDTRDELLEHADFVVTLLKPHSKEAAEETDRSVKELVEAYENLEQNQSAAFSARERLKSCYVTPERKLSQFTRKLVFPARMPQTTAGPGDVRDDMCLTIAAATREPRTGPARCFREATTILRRPSLSRGYKLYCRGKCGVPISGDEMSHRRTRISVEQELPQGA
ncbi:hypothetical protein MSG28_006559 [Choristoneura fumiferana]|uniref:Uncharacterized protein n=1 Tax=Choristoneura fumiferana TaxID=7141 RepID=A0ACC0JFH8_CHOFU|nr:hypothetical protein MSG28_006559 [Choristoneura fumiferana]